jgi:predicted Zn-dependent protease
MERDHTSRNAVLFFVLTVTGALLYLYAQKNTLNVRPLPKLPVTLPLSIKSSRATHTTTSSTTPTTGTTSDLETVHTIQNEITESTTTKKVVGETAEAQPNSIYTPLNEGVSDTDEGYVSKIAPCTSPVGYKIGTVDERFGLARATVEKEVETAVHTWEDAAGRDLFYPSATGPLTINLIYDERQANTIHIGYTRMEIENTKEAAEEVKRVYDQEKELYTGDVALYEQDAKRYNERNILYNKKVEDFNAKGGASRIEYDAMMSELESLKSEASSLEARRLTLVDQMNRINERVRRYNELVSYANTLIKKSNAVAAKKITEGRYSPATLSIDIYQYSDMLKLKRVILHELGHALGLLHTDTMESIMYAFNSGTTVTLSNEDIRDLKKICTK